MVVGARELVGAAKGFHAKAERIEDQSQPKRIAQLLHIAAMPQQLSHENRLRVVRLLLDKWPAKDISREVGCNCTTIYHIKDNLLKYGSTYKPQLKPKGRPTKIPESAKDAVEAFLKEHPEAHQKDVRIFLFRECGVEVHQSSVSRLLKGDCQNGKKGILESPRTNKSSANQFLPGRPLCGRPDCTQYNSPPGQVSPSQQSSGPQISEPRSSEDHPIGGQPIHRQPLGPPQTPEQRLSDNLPPDRHPSGPRPFSPNSEGHPAHSRPPPLQHTLAQPPLLGRPEYRPVDAVPRLPENPRSNFNGAVDPALEQRPRQD
ncbi:MAG: hypothetical protein L6R41_005374 [Letrouitia leprolyta]|nr:MAG: hypothetical protein L6R41_005374 [Letrouitia leprolyta]